MAAISEYRDNQPPPVAVSDPGRLGAASRNFSSGALGALPHQGHRRSMSTDAGIAGLLGNGRNDSSKMLIAKKHAHKKRFFSFGCCVTTSAVVMGTAAVAIGVFSYAGTSGVFA